MPKHKRARTPQDCGFILPDQRELVAELSHKNCILRRKSTQIYTILINIDKIEVDPFLSIYENKIIHFAAKKKEKNSKILNTIQKHCNRRYCHT